VDRPTACVGLPRMRQPGSPALTVRFGTGRHKNNEYTTGTMGRRDYKSRDVAAGGL